MVSRQKQEDAMKCTNDEENILTFDCINVLLQIDSTFSNSYQCLHHRMTENQRFYGCLPFSRLMNTLGTKTTRRINHCFIISRTRSCVLSWLLTESAFSTSLLSNLATSPLPIKPDRTAFENRVQSGRCRFVRRLPRGLYTDCTAVVDIPRNTSTIKN